MEFNFETLPLFLMIDDSFIQSYLATSAAFGELPFLHKILLDRASPSPTVVCAALLHVLGRHLSNSLVREREREREDLPVVYTTFPSSIA
jgi:hypothetical protein